LNVVLSFGDLSHASGYRTRILGELQALDSQSGDAPFLLVFDRSPDEFEKTFSINVPYRVIRRSAALRFFSAISRLARQSPIGMIHAHNLYSAALALSVRRLYGYKVVLDYHGRIPEEYVYTGKGGEPSRKALEALERWAVRKADHVVVVSSGLAAYLSDRYRIPSANMSVIPCCADDTSFKWDPHRREAVRHSLNVSDKLVCTHLGSFFEWYDPELLVRVFSRIRERRDSHFLVVASQVEQIRRYLAARLPAGVFTVMSAAHSEVPGLLNASDLGFLLLRPSPNIKTSSPAKFSEYLNCGLPVAITRDVGDFSAVVAGEKVGAIVDEDGVIDVNFLEALLANRQELAGRSVAAGRSLTWSAFRPAWLEINSRLFKT
jgi:glycosyltransferase involved in cell wall biosynthesis